MARVPYRGPDDVDEQYRDYVVSSLQPGKAINVYAAAANNPAVLEGLRAFLSSLWDSSGLTSREREIVILTTAAETGNAYEWHQHVNIAADGLLTRGELAAIADDDPTPFDASEVALAEYTRAVVGRGVTDGVHAALSEHLDDRALTGAAATAAGYLALGRMIDAFGVEVEADDEFVGWDPR
jgi:4-carboxymuconolactone decarboxylase